ncbi:hypothetical protein TwortDSMZ_191 [Staphylococcus phage Twort]|uniref:Uncharacterized protein n=2 Tax=Staphylococcus phage Twort (strain DSM 17442 / HER 48) TaxID=2908167 RepID=A0A6H0X5S1_BPTWO|nr:ORF095 [Staphylococcus phage Twort]AAX92389.1 ORF095 [Staphylococcus phage Twort]QIW89016.1 hypothetical protein TwortDSMZ_002 [Staphylococcus phage Twort]QIW89187.1 hypothetical protein TwortDSMZ_191 [Staphylococcus phage Twort]
MKIKKQVTFKELMGLYYKGELEQGDYEAEQGNTIVKVSCGIIGISFSQFYKNKDMFDSFPYIKNDTLFTIEQEIGLNTKLDKVVVVYEDTADIEYDISVNNILRRYDFDAEDYIVSINVEVNNELQTVWKDGKLL